MKYLALFCVALFFIGALFLLHGKDQNLGADKVSPIVKVTPETIASEQERIYAEKGKYVQILESGTVQDSDFSLKQIPRGVYVHTYEAPCGDGYDVVIDTATSTSIRSYGCLAEQRTMMLPKSTRIATST